MKKTLLGFLFLFLINLFLYSETTVNQIVDYNFNIKGNFWGTTKENNLISNFPVDTKSIFNDSELNSYIENYKQKLRNTRLFESVEIEASTIETIEKEEAEDVYINKISLIINISDSNHLLAIPYPKFSSNDGFTLKIKAKDTNFLGSLNEMNFDLNVNYFENRLSPGFNFSYNHPFTIGNNKLNWVNDYSMSYTVGEQYPDFTAITGVEYVKPYGNYSYNLSVLQYVQNNNSYTKFNDNFYFTEKINFSTPIILKRLTNYSNLVYSPFISISYNWDFDGINQFNEALYSPILLFGHSISNANINWNNNFRRGYSLSLSNNYQYNLNNSDFYPSLSFEAQYYYNFKNNFKKEILNQFGIYTNFYAFVNLAHFIDPELNNFDYGDTLGNRLRGKRDNEDLGFPNKNTAPMGIAINIDLPHHIFETNFGLDILNFDMQIAPFIDIGIYSFEGSRKPSLKDGIYCAGAELLIFPRKFSSFTVRASLGMDVLKVLKNENDIKAGIKNLNNYEWFIGIGTSY